MFCVSSAWRRHVLVGVTRPAEKVDVAKVNGSKEDRRLQVAALSTEPIAAAGHSLGGALATLAAIDLQRVSSFPRLQVYTYGAPRTGNHAFAREYEALVPHTWHLINDRSGFSAASGRVLLSHIHPKSAGPEF